MKQVKWISRRAILVIQALFVGFASLADISGSIYFQRRPRNHSPMESLSRDWQRVGEFLRGGMDRYRDELARKGA